jgi:glycosyltransferase involved in cell wall biosynthesis
VSTYPPRECGIATYTKSLTEAINLLNPACLADIIAIDDETPDGEQREYPWEVKYKIEQENPLSWIKAAEYINQSSAEVVNLQHEFGIYGGEIGENVIPLLKAIKKPVIVCFHTVLADPTPKMKALVRQISELAAGLIVIIDTAGEYLSRYYDVDPSKIVTIPHGVPDIPFGGTAIAKKQLGYQDWNILSSFGLMSSDKGYEYAIEALPTILKKHPRTKLLLLGQTHPVVKRQVGEEYRNSLQTLIDALKLNDHVEFVNRYLSLEEIIGYLRASDIYITPYIKMDQVSSGTLSYALSAGKACISTPYVYATEVLANNRGLLMNRDDAVDLAAKVNFLLDNPKARQEIRKNAYEYGRHMIWPRVALNHLDLFEIVKEDYATKPTL